MRKALLLILILFHSYASANEDLDLHEITLYELSKLVFTTVNRMQFYADDEFIKDQSQHTVIFKDMSSRQQKNEVIKMIRRAGYYVEANRRIIRISKEDHSIAPQREPLVYRPLYRTPQYIKDQLSSFFNNSDFATDRKLKSSATQKGGQRSNIDDSGTSAFSQISKGSDLIVLNVTKKRMELFNRLITKIDVPEKQVQINAYMYEVKKGQNQRSSLDLFVDLLGSRLGLEFAGDTTQNRLKLNLPSITAVLSLLNKSDDFELLSSPFLLAKNNQNAKFVVGSEVPVLGQIVQNQNGQATQSVEYRQAGVIFDVTPRILNDTIELTINHQISSFINTTNGVNNSPTLIKRELTSVINAKHNDLVMLGGLQENTTTQVHSKLPFLPISFHGRSREDQDTEIMLLMSVQLI